MNLTQKIAAINGRPQREKPMKSRIVLKITLQIAYADGSVEPITDSILREFDITNTNRSIAEREFSNVKWGFIDRHKND